MNGTKSLTTSKLKRRNLYKFILKWANFDKVTGPYKLNSYSNNGAHQEILQKQNTASLFGCVGEMIRGKESPMVIDDVEACASFTSQLYILKIWFQTFNLRRYTFRTLGLTVI